MKKKAMIASLMALALLVSPIGSLGSMHQVSAEEEPETVVYSASGNASGAGETTEKVQSTAFTNLKWGDEKYVNGKYAACWECTYVIPDDEYFDVVSWDIEYYKDDQLIHSSWIGYDMYESRWDSETQQWVETDILRKQFSAFPEAREICEWGSGSYKFRVRNHVYEDEEWSSWSPSIDYVRPEQEPGVTSGYWDTEKVGIFHFEALDIPGNRQDLIEYRALLLKQREDGSWPLDDDPSEDDFWSNKWVLAEDYQGDAVIDVDFSDRISEGGEGKYCVTVWALSLDIDVIVDGKEGPTSGILDTTVNADKLSGILSGAEGMGAADTVTVLKDSAEFSAIQQAMQTSDDFREQVKDLENRYAAEQNITVEAPAVSDTAKEYVDPGKVSLVGAAFNAAQGQKVGLQMDVTPAENRVPTYSGYKKNVQLDIRLVSGSTEIHDLAMPVSVTMPVPQGINVSQLVILHYHADGTTEATAFHVNGDGTITFTVSSFSTFVFAEESAADTPSDKPVSTPSQNASGNSGSSGWTAAQGSLESRIASAVPGATIKVTRDQNINTLSNSIMQMLVKRGDVTLEMEYTYEGADYHVIIPAGKAVDNDIAWYGPLYLSAYFSAGDAGTESISTYIVQKGDTLGKIARNNNTTVARLAAANPQIKNVNRIVPGQVINIK